MRHLRVRWFGDVPLGVCMTNLVGVSPCGGGGGGAGTQQASGEVDWCRPVSAS